MPLLPTRNNLDYNPNSIVNASKTIKTIALENMKNPVTDPDMKTLSSMDAERNLKTNLEMLQQMYIDIESDLLKLSQFSGTSIATGFAGMMGSGMYGGAGSTKSDDSAYAGLGALSGLFTQPKPRGRPKGSKNKKAPALTASNLPTTTQRSIASYFTGAPSSSAPSVSNLSVTQRRALSQQQRFQPTLTPFATNSQAVPNRHPDDSDPDDDSSSLPSSASSSNSRTIRSARSGRSVSTASSPHFEINVNSLPYILTNLLVSINSKVQKLDFFFNSKIKPAYRKLTASQQGFLASFLQTIYKLYNETFRSSGSGAYITDYSNDLETFIINNVESGDELLQTLKKNIDKLILDLSIGLNASKQASGSGGTTINTEPADNYALELAGFVGSGRKPKMMTGCGRNFYGETINNARDIPTIRRSYQDCPTKYLL